MGSAIGIPPILRIVPDIPSPSGQAELHEKWGSQLADARVRYEQERNEQARVEYLRMLQVFADLVLRNRIPEE